MRVNLKRFKDLKLLVSLHFAFPRFQAKFSRIVKGPPRGSHGEPLSSKFQLEAFERQ